MSLRDEIRENVVVDDNGCWLWQKSLMGAGYAQVCWNGAYLDAYP